ncbi:hypothetical protein IE53DRAFT_238726 [Violaceomyces palustris]|uniref:Uncharacterized protein n=1 Tax=Violaceomyces palustris TaxID=1673888 RepID=A0ACD0NP69_9BASI|nr:hypothetical protein IE53DRAFT_238726 [Violaceomyces palustris]
MGRGAPIDLLLAFTPLLRTLLVSGVVLCDKIPKVERPRVRTRAHTFRSLFFQCITHQRITLRKNWGKSEWKSEQRCRGAGLGIFELPLALNKGEWRI